MATVHIVTEQEPLFGMYTFAIARPHVHTHNKEHIGAACVNDESRTDLCGHALRLLGEGLPAFWWLLARQAHVRAGRSAVHLRGSTSALCRRLPRTRRPLSDGEPHWLPGPGVLQEARRCVEAADMLQRLAVPDC